VRWTVAVVPERALWVTVADDLRGVVLGSFLAISTSGSSGAPRFVPAFVLDRVAIDRALERRRYGFCAVPAFTSGGRPRHKNSLRSVAYK